MIPFPQSIILAAIHGVDMAIQPGMTHFKAIRRVFAPLLIDAIRDVFFDYTTLHGRAWLLVYYRSLALGYRITKTGINDWRRIMKIPPKSDKGFTDVNTFGPHQLTIDSLSFQTGTYGIRVTVLGEHYKTAMVILKWVRVVVIAVGLLLLYVVCTRVICFLRSRTRSK